MTTVSQLLGDLTEERNALANAYANNAFDSLAQKSSCIGRMDALKNVIERLRDLEPNPLKLQAGRDYKMRSGLRVRIHEISRNGSSASGTYFHDDGDMGGASLWEIDGTFDPNQGETCLDIVGEWGDQNLKPEGDETTYEF